MGQQESSGQSPQASVEFADAVTALEDDQAITLRDDLSALEDRYITLGMDSVGRLLVVVYSWRDDTLRLISPRQATAREWRQYGAKP